jgi:Zn finger protein HypA/HybF involved in hydrogenase expression
MPVKKVKFYVEEHPVTKELIDEVIEVELPATREKCETCDGTGSTYLGWAAKDQPAFTDEDFAREGPDFKSEYVTGKWNQTCPECKGNKIVLMIGENPGCKLTEAYREDLQMEAEHQAEIDAERRMGC